MSHIIVESVTKTFSGTRTPTIDNISLEVKKGEILTLLGPSGCGKTTLLRLIAGFETPDSGAISLGGQMVAGPAWVPPEKRGVGMVFQDLALFPHLSVANNIRFGLGRGADLSWVLKLTGLAGLEERLPEQLSGGQQQRVALARALVRKPLVILLDEPFSSLDAHLRLQLRAEVPEIIRQAGLTAILVTHDQQDALAVSDRIAVINNGKLEQVGSPDQIWKQPRTAFVANFVGRSNIIAGLVQAGGWVDTKYGRLPGPVHMAPGTQVRLSVRPEAFKVCLAGEGTVAGQVESCSFCGEMTRARLKSADQTFLEVAFPGGYRLDRGRCLELKVNPEDVTLLEH